MSSSPRAAAPLPQVAAALLAASRRASDAPPQLALPAALRPALEAELGRLGRCGGWRAALPWRRRRRLQLVRLRSFWPHFSAELLGELLRMDEARAHVAAALTLDLLELRWTGARRTPPFPLGRAYPPCPVPTSC